MAGRVTANEMVKRQDSQILAMLAAGMKQYEIAEALGISARTVIRAVKRSKGDLELVDEKLSEVQRQLHRQMPIRERVEGLVRVARESEMDFARLHSIKYLNELDGIHPQLEREKLKRDRETSQPGPMFVLPAGAQVSVTINNNRIADSVSAAPDPDVIDITTRSTDGE